MNLSSSIRFQSFNDGSDSDSSLSIDEETTQQPIFHSNQPQASVEILQANSKPSQIAAQPEEEVISTLRKSRYEDFGEESDEIENPNAHEKLDTVLDNSRANLTIHNNNNNNHESKVEEKEPVQVRQRPDPYGPTITFSNSDTFEDQEISISFSKNNSGSIYSNAKSSHVTFSSHNLPLPISVTEKKSRKNSNGKSLFFLILIDLISL